MARRMAQKAARRLLRPVGAIPEAATSGQTGEVFADLDFCVAALKGDLEGFRVVQKIPENFMHDSIAGRQSFTISVGAVFIR